MRRLGAFVGPLGRGAMPWLLAASGLAFVGLALRSRAGAAGGAPHHGAHDAGVVAGHLAAIPGLLPDQLAGWLLMVVAMMLPLVSMPLVRLWHATQPRARAGTTAAFVATYVGSWCVAGFVLLPVAAVLARVDGAGAPIGALLIALLWSGSPWSQRARSRCHRAVRIAGRAPKAYLDAMRQGLVTASGCLGVCWPWMLLPMLLIEGHLAAMLAVTAYLFADRIAPLSPPGWRIPPAFETLVGPAVRWRRVGGRGASRGGGATVSPVGGLG
jgi:predicted metal-binding membrane protein